MEFHREEAMLNPRHRACSGQAGGEEVSEGLEGGGRFLELSK